MNESQLTPECEAVQAELGAYADGELLPAEQAAVEQHLAACGACEAELALLRLVTQSLRLAPRPEPSEAMRQRLLDQVTEELPLHRVTLVCTERHGDEVLHRHEVRLTREPALWPLPVPVSGSAWGHIVRRYRQAAGPQADCYQLVESNYGRNHDE